MTAPHIDIETFTWENLNADVHHALHDDPVRLYLDNIVKPAMDFIDAKLEELGRSTEPERTFELADWNDLRRSTIQAFTLAIQSLWERQFREFLKGSARELKRDENSVTSLEKIGWVNLVKTFEELRGLPMQAFSSFEDLELLQLLGNACRHGDGKSAKDLFKRWPDLWPMWPPAPYDCIAEVSVTNVPKHPPFAEISIPRALLDQLGDAVIRFWEDHHYIFTNSIRNKPEGLADALQYMREVRARRPPKRPIHALRAAE